MFCHRFLLFVYILFLTLQSAIGLFCSESLLADIVRLINSHIIITIGHRSLYSISPYGTHDLGLRRFQQRSRNIEVFTLALQRTTDDVFAHRPIGTA